jgi:hypothetical protein
MKRNENEDFKDYKERRTEANDTLKQKLKGKMVWFSKHLYTNKKEYNKGTYNKSEHGDLS